MNQEAQIGNALRQANPQDAVSVAVMARELVRSGMKLDEKSLNREILSGLMLKANLDDPQSLKALCKELIEQGYGPKLIAPTPLANENLIVINPIKINPSVQGQMPGRGWAFIWELDRACDNFNWLIGAHITVDGRLYTVQGIENMPNEPQIGDRLTLLCSAVALDTEKEERVA